MNAIVHLVGEVVQDEKFVQGTSVERFAFRLVSVTPQVTVTEVLHPDQSGVLVVQMNLGHADTNPCEKLGDVDVVPVFLPLAAVLGEDHGMLVAAVDTVKKTVGPAFFERLHFEHLPRERGETKLGFLKEFLHGLGATNQRQNGFLAPVARQ